MTNPVQWPIPFGNYLLDGPIAHGGMARLYRARLRGVSGFEKPLAVKQMRPELAQDPRFVKLFVEEARALVRLGHPHIVTVYELGIVEGTYFLAMEHVEGASLAEILRDGPLPPEVVAHIGAQTADALAHAHGRHGLVHRDMTPRNVLVDVSGYVRVVDFGIAAYEGAGDALGLGSPGYMAPEQLRGEKTGTEVDVFALAATLYYAALGKHAFYEEDLARVRERVLSGVCPDFGALPEPLAKLLAGCFALDRAARPTAASLAASLRSYVSSVHPEGVAETLARRVDRALEHAPEGTVETPTSTPIQTEREPTIRTLATNVALSEALIGHPQTQPMTGAPHEAPRHVPRTAGRVVAIVALCAAAVVAWMGMRTDTTRPVAGTEARDASVPDRPIAAPPPDASAAIVVSYDAAAPDAAQRTDQTIVDAGAREAGVATPRSAQGTLTIAATPWADVRVDGRTLGRTPKRGVQLASGAHTVELDCPPLGRRARTRIRIEPGAETRIVADLTRDPPNIRVR